MINEKELNVSSLSYINKDFQAIYPELLDLVKTLTNRWDPASSNESDPGVVLLKVGALLADHLNYNIDKNILEAFLPSATQEESVRYIAEFGGYTPRYYRSAIGNVNVVYNPESFPGSFKIPAFSLVISNDDGSITYTQLEDIEVTSKNVAATGRFIEGTVQRLSVDSDVITLKNLDNNNRLYFPTQYVAENGVYIWNVQNGQPSSSLWTKTNYLYTRPQGSKCYKIDFDSKKSLPYIEFPSDIANLIENGLMINYIYTAGSYGNVRAGELNTIVSINSDAIGFDVDVDDFTITNSSSISNGTEPETIDEIYRSYKRTVGTFDTLVSLQDYTNAINTVEDDYGQRYISNGVVTDRRVDYNGAINITTNTALGNIVKNEPINSFGKFVFKGASTTPPLNPEPGWIYSNGTTTKLCTSVNDDGTGNWETIEDLDYNSLSDYLGGMTPYDLIIYAFQKYSEADYNSIYYWRALNNSYRQIPSQSAVDNIDNIENLLISELEQYKCINHVFGDLKDGDVYCFKNYLPLNITIVPFNKVSNYERAEIINNVRKCISDNFNASMVEFGEGINYDELRRAIEDCDERINYVNIADFNYNTKVMLKHSDTAEPAPEYSLFEQNYDGVTFIADLVAKNILAGRLCLFDFDENFDYQYGQTDCKVYSNISQIVTELALATSKSDSDGNFTYDYTLKENEYVEIIYPRYYSEKTYGSYVLYHANLINEVAAGTEYTLSAGEYIDLYYKDSDNAIRTSRIPSGSIINASFTLRSFNADAGYTYTKTVNGATLDYKQIASNESISVRGRYRTVFDTYKYVYWAMSNPNNALFEAGKSETVLGDNEYFLYTDASKQYLTILGRGTKLYRQANQDTPAMMLPLTVENKTIRQRMSDEGLAADIPFEYYDFSGTGSGGLSNVLVIEQSVITTLGPDSTIRFKCKSNKVNYNLVTANEISYITPDGNTTTLPSQADFYQIRTRLDLNLASDRPQVLYSSPGDTSSTQTISVKSGANPLVPLTADGGRYLISNVDINTPGNSNSGGINMDIYADFNISVNWMQYSLSNYTRTVFERTNTHIPTNWSSWGATINNEYKLFDGSPTTEEVNAYYTTVPTQHTEPEIPSVIDGSVPGIYSIPFSPIWYDYLSNSEAIINRQYIMELYYGNPDEEEGESDVVVNVTDMATGNTVPLEAYGAVGGSGNMKNLLNNKSVYLYPRIDSYDPQNPPNLVLNINVSPIYNSYVTVKPLKVTWGYNTYGAGGYGDQIISRIEDILKKTGTDVQFHWTNVPNNEMAISNEDLTDPYSLFDKNNVANIITIPQIDLENSTIEVIKSMRK